jgi:hypothetical protein
MTDMPITGAQRVVAGVEGLGKPAEAFATPDKPGGYGNKLTPELRKQASAAGTEIITGGLEVATPFMIAGAAVAPVTALKAVGLYAGTEYATRKGLESAGVAPEHARFFGQVAGLASGSIPIGLKIIDARLEAHNEIAEKLFQEEAEGGQRIEKMRDVIAQSPEIAKPIPVSIGGKPHEIRFLDVGKNGRLSREVIDLKTGKRVYAGYDKAVSGWLHIHADAEQGPVVKLTVKDATGKVIEEGLITPEQADFAKDLVASKAPDHTVTIEPVEQAPKPAAEAATTEPPVTSKKGGSERVTPEGQQPGKEVIQPSSAEAPAPKTEAGATAPTADFKPGQVWNLNGGAYAVTSIEADESGKPIVKYDFTGPKGNKNPNQKIPLAAFTSMMSKGKLQGAAEGTAAPPAAAEPPAKAEAAKPVEMPSEAKAEPIKPPLKPKPAPKPVESASRQAPPADAAKSESTPAKVAGVISRESNNLPNKAPPEVATPKAVTEPPAPKLDPEELPAMKRLRAAGQAISDTELTQLQLPKAKVILAKLKQVGEAALAEADKQTDPSAAAELRRVAAETDKRAESIRNRAKVLEQEQAAKAAPKATPAPPTTQNAPSNEAKKQEVAADNLTEGNELSSASVKPAQIIPKDIPPVTRAKAADFKVDSAKPEDLVASQDFQKWAGDPNQKRSFRDTYGDAIRIADQIRDAIKSGRPAATIEAQREALREALEEIGVKAEAKPTDLISIPARSKSRDTDKGYEQWAKDVHNLSLSTYRDKTPFAPSDLTKLTDTQLEDLKSAVDEAASWHPKVQPGRDLVFTSPEQAASMKWWDKQRDDIKKEFWRRGEPAREAEKQANKVAADKKDQEAFERATTVRPKNPTLKDVDAQRDKDIPEGYRVSGYSGGQRLLTQAGQFSVYQTFDTREWGWYDEKVGPSKKVKERYQEGVKSPITQKYIDDETAYIYGPWAKERKVATAPPPAQATVPPPSAVDKELPAAKKNTVEPSVERYEELQKEVRAIQKNPVYAEDTHEGMQLRDRALELEDEMLLHRKVAIAKYQADIDREKAEREAKAKKAEPPAVKKAEHKPAPAAEKPLETKEEKKQTKAEEKPDEQPKRSDDRAVGEGPKVSGTRKPSVRPIAGEGTKIRVPGRDRAYAAVYSVRELSDTYPSHDPFSFERNADYHHLNDRDYTDPVAQTRVIVNSGAKFDPDYLITDDPTATNGPSIIDPDGNVLGGNNRRMTLERVYAQNPKGAAAYRALLVKKAAVFGLDPKAIEGIKKPILVRELKDADVKPQRAITDLNKGTTAALSQGERATADARSMTAETASHIASVLESVGPDVNLNDVLSSKYGPVLINRLIREGIFTEEERPALLDDKNGTVTKEAKNRTAKMLLGDLFTDNQQFERAEPSLRNKLERTVVWLKKVERVPRWGLTKDVRDAISLIEHERDEKEYQEAHGFKAGGFLAENQADMFGGAGERPQVSEKAERIAEFIKGNSQKSIAQAFKSYAADAAKSYAADAAKAEELFAERAQEMPTGKAPGEAFDDSFGAAKKEPEPSAKADTGPIKTQAPPQAAAEPESASRQTAPPPGAGSVTLGGGLGALDPYVEEAIDVAKKYTPLVMSHLAELPPVQGAAETMKLARQAFDPRHNVSFGALNSVMKRNGSMVEFNWILQQLGDRWRSLFDAMPARMQVGFVDAIRHGRKQKAQFPARSSLLGKREAQDISAPLQEAADFFRGVDDDLYHSLQEVGVNPEYLENHYRTLWKVIPSFGEPSDKRGFKGVTKQRLEGTKGMLKKHVFEDMSEGLRWDFSALTEEEVHAAMQKAGIRPDGYKVEQGVDNLEVTPFSDKAIDALNKLEKSGAEVVKRGGTPTYWNAMTMFQAHYADALRFVTTRRMWKDGIESGRIRFVKRGMKPLDGFKRIDDAIAKVNIPVKTSRSIDDATQRVKDGVASDMNEAMQQIIDEHRQRGSVITATQVMAPVGEWYVEEGLARLLNNLQSRDRIREYALGRGLSRIKNGYTGIELGVSPFHFVFESIEAMGSMFALAFREAYLGVGKMTFERNRPGSTSLGKRLMWQSLKDLTGALPSATPGFRFGKVSAAPLVHEFSIEQLGASAKLLYGQAGKPYLETEQLKDAIAGYNKSLEFMRPSNPRYNDLISQRASAEAQLAAAQGDYNEALKKFASGKVGQRFLERYPDAAPLIHDYFQAGGKPHMDERFRLRATENFRTAYKNAVADHRELAAAGNALLAINEAMLAPLFETFIPNLKLGIFLKEYSFAKVENERKLERVENLRKGIDRIQYEIAQLNDERRRTPASHPPGVPVDPARMAKIQGIEDRLRAKTEQLNKTQIEHDAMQAQRGYSLEQIARETNDFVEDRFGEMNFDNLFWNNTIKTCLQLAFRSVTWKLGNARATGKGVRGGWRTMRDFYKALPGLASGTGEAPALEAHFSWLFTTMMLAVTVSAILSKMMGHQSFKDTFRKLAEGDWTEAVYFHSDEVGGRNSFASYARDWVHLARSIGGYISSSYAGDIGRFMDLLRGGIGKGGKDFYGTEVYHPADPWYEQAKDIAGHMIPMPFAAQSFFKSREQGQPLSSQVLGLLGFTKAPTDITDSPAVRAAKEAAAETVSVGARTKEQFEKTKDKSQLMNKLKRGEDVYDQAMDLVGKGKLTVKDLEDVAKQYRTPPLTRAIQRITDPDKLLEVWEKATNEEKAEIQSLLLNKLGSVVRNRPGQWTPRIEQRVAKDEVETWRPPQQIRTAPPPGVEGY